MNCYLERGTFYKANDETLCHWKYISRKKKNGKWEYTYPEDVPYQKGTIAKTVDKGKSLLGKAINAGKKAALKTTIGKDIQRASDFKKLSSDVESFYDDAKKRYKKAFTKDQNTQKTSNHTDEFYEIIMKDPELKKKYDKIMGNRLTATSKKEEWKTKQTQIPADKQISKDYEAWKKDYQKKQREKEARWKEASKRESLLDRKNRITSKAVDKQTTKDYKAWKKKQKEKVNFEKSQIEKAKEYAYRLSHPTATSKNAWDSDFFEKLNKKRRK